VDNATLVAVLLPFIAIELGLMAWGLWDLTRKPVWAAIIIFIGMVGPAIYLLFGREET
jgi:hypothetical protein